MNFITRILPFAFFLFSATSSFAINYHAVVVGLSYMARQDYGGGDFTTTHCINDA